ncbi:hypothetical protein [Arsukibacterium perlucidum]|uniref:hypothetical protein n=1 Tax=Arsukibacterium perlucidum TaxID=368811 RepID=UPI000368DB63|nr:hypothetical protein [Arsukibacterium perlucidum]
MKGWFRFTVWAKVSTVVAFISTFVGVAFQKGMMQKMGFGNMSGNYQIEEIIANALHAYLMTIDAITKISTWKVLVANSYIILAFILMALVVWLADKKKDHIERLQKRSKNYVQSRLQKSFSSSYGATILGALLGAFVWLGTGLFKYVLVLVFAVLLLPIYASYALGQKYIGGLMDNDVCLSVSEKTKDKEVAQQCTQLTIKGNKLMGRLILERHDGHFLQTNEAFIFISKNGEKCLYSVYMTQSEMAGRKLGEYKKICVSGILPMYLKGIKNASIRPAYRSVIS